MWGHHDAADAQRRNQPPKRPVWVQPTLQVHWLAGWHGMPNAANGATEGLPRNTHTHCGISNRSSRANRHRRHTEMLGVWRGRLQHCAVVWAMRQLTSACLDAEGRTGPASRAHCVGSRRLQ